MQNVQKLHNTSFNLIGVKNNKKPSPGRPKGAQGHLTGVAVKHFKP